MSDVKTIAGWVVTYVMPTRIGDVPRVRCVKEGKTAELLYMESLKEDPPLLPELYMAYLRAHIVLGFSPENLLELSEWMRGGA